MFPTGWQRGLLWIPALYLAFMGALFYGRSIAIRGKAVDGDINRVIQAADKGQVAGDLPAVHQANAELASLTAEMRQLHVASLVLAVGIAIGFLLFVWATWQITQNAVSRWERFARWGVLLVPLLSILMVVGGRSVPLEILRKLFSIAISIGHHHALHKIAAYSGSRDVAERIDWLYRSFYRFVLLMLILPMTGVLQQGPNWLGRAYEEILLGVAGLFVMALAFTLWKLRNRLLAVSAVLATADTGLSDDEEWEEDD